MPTDQHQIDLIRDVADLKARVEIMETQLIEIRADMKRLLDLANRGKGGIAVMLAMGGVLGALGSALGRKLGLMP